MPLSSYFSLFSPKKSQTDLEAQNQPSNIIRIPRWKFGLITMTAVEVTPNNIEQVMLELNQADADLSTRIDLTDNALLYAQAISVALLALMQIIKVGVDRINGTDQTANSHFNVSIDTVCLCIPVLVALVSAACKITRDYAIGYKKEIQQEQPSLPPAAPAPRLGMS